MFKKSKQSESSFGQQQAFSPRQSTTPSSPLAWSSILTRTSHLKLDASSNILSAPLESLLLLRHNFVKMTVGVPYVCDWCNCQFEPNMARFHCFDCEDFDECAQCHGRHIQGNPLHRVFDITGISSASSTVPSQDPLIAKLLATTPATTTTPTTANAKPKNRTTEIEIQKAKRLLLAMLTWWSVVHKWLPSPGALPDVLDEVFPAEMARAFANGSAVDLSAIGVKIVDTLEREAGLKTAA
ncbi:hypothetical protein BDR26DRAFT_860430 [Obelidium mucronatum]|nr:hypothetical protein BDR26DRAFT_860430 [Obelidium mucronatum]